MLKSYTLHIQVSLTHAWLFEVLGSENVKCLKIMVMHSYVIYFVRHTRHDFLCV